MIFVKVKKWTRW